MNGNNNRQRMGAFVDFPEYDLSRVPQRQALPVEQPRGLVSMGHLMDGGGMPSREGMPAMMPQEQLPQEQLPQQQDYGDEGQPQGKKILGMPKDQFIALMGTIAQAFGGDSASGRMGAGLVNMAKMMREERMGKGRAQAEAAKEKRDAAAKKREGLEKKKEKAPTVRTFRVGDMDVQHTYDYDTGEWKPIPGMKGKKVKEAEGKEKPPTIRTFRVGGMDVQHAWETDTGKWKPVPGMPGKKVTPPADEKPPTHAEKRAQREELRKLESTVRGVNPKTGKANIEYEESQISVDAFNELSDKSYILRRTPKQEIDWGRDIPAKAEEVPISQFKTPEDIMAADYLSEKAKRRLLLKRFPSEFE